MLCTDTRAAFYYVWDDILILCYIYNGKNAKAARPNTTLIFFVIQHHNTVCITFLKISLLYRTNDSVLS